MFILIFIITLLILVLIHELGHFLMAKVFGIKVLEFGFGIPPRVWSKKIGETIYSVNWLPVGGFVRLLGEDEEDPKILQDKRSFARQTVEKRLMVVVAGVAMNLFLAWLIFYFVIIYNGFRIIVPTPEPVVAVTHVEENSPAKIAGLSSGDRILAVNDEFVKKPEDFSTKIKQQVGKEVELAISDWRGDNIHKVRVIPRQNPPSGQGPLGIGLSELAFKVFTSPIEKLFSGPIYSFELTKLTIQGFGALFEDVSSGNFHKASDQVAGPIGIAVITKNIVSQGIDAIIPYLYFVGLLSLTLSIMNILPIPALDGGRIFFLLIEAIIRKKVNPVVEKYIHSVGMVILIGLIFLVSYSDIRKFIL